MPQTQRKAGVTLSYVSILLHNLIGILYTPFMLRMMGQTQYGLYALVGSVISYLALFDLGFGNTLIRYVSKYKTEGRDNEVSNLMGLVFKIQICICFIALLGGTILYFNAQNLFDKTMSAVEISDIKTMMLIMTASVSLSFPLSMFASICTAYEKFIFPKIVNIVNILLLPTIMIPLLLHGYKAVAMSIVVASLTILSMLANLIYCICKLKVKIKFGKIPGHLTKEIFGYTFFIFLGGIIDQIYWQTGQFVLGITTSATAVAIYAVGMTFRSYFFSFSTAISGVFLPKITQMVTNKCSNSELSDIFIKIGRVQFLIVGFILFGFIVYGKEFICLWAGYDYAVSYYVALIILIPVTVPLIQNTGLLILQAKNRQKFRTYLYLAIAVLSLFISYPLSKVIGPIGVAIGTSSMLILGNVISINIYYYKAIGIDIPRFWKQISKLAFPMIAISIIAFYVNLIFNEYSIVTLIIKILLFSTVFIFIVWKYGMNRYERELIGRPILKLMHYKR